MNPGELIQAGRAGDPDARARLLEGYRNFLGLLARTALKGAMAAKVGASDAAQEAIVKAHQGFGQFRGATEAELVAWLRRILANTVSNLRRRFVGNEGRSLAREEPIDVVFDRSSQALRTLLPEHGSSPSQRAARRERVVLLADALARLDEDHREVIVLRSIHELDWSEVGSRMDRTTDAARVLWGRALRALGREMKDCS
jgi:RNA polymerase sigma-70 factor (ECF subfamily)